MASVSTVENKTTRCPTELKASTDPDDIASHAASNERMNDASAAFKAELMKHLREDARVRDDEGAKTLYEMQMQEIEEGDTKSLVGRFSWKPCSIGAEAARCLRRSMYPCDFGGCVMQRKFAAEWPRFGLASEALEASILARNATIDAGAFSYTRVESVEFMRCAMDVLAIARLINERHAADASRGDVWPIC